MSLAQGHTLGATVTKHESNCLICNQGILGLGEDFGQVSLSNVNSLCQILSFPELGGLELGSSKALIAFCNDCGGRVETFQNLLVQLNEIMGQMERIRQELSQQLLESAKTTNGYAYIINTRKLFAAQLLGVKPQPSQVLSMPSTSETNGRVYASATLANSEKNMDSSYVAVPPELFSSTDFQVDQECQGQESFSDGNGNAAYYLQQESFTSACSTSTPAEETFRLITQEYVHPESQPSDTEDCVCVSDEEDESCSSSTSSNVGTGSLKCALIGCTLRFETKQEMLGHFNCHYPQMFECTLCPKVCSTAFFLKQHVITIHDLHGPETLQYRLVSSPFKCTYPGCAAGFVDREKINKHFRKKHNGKYIPPPPPVNVCAKIGKTVTKPSTKPLLHKCTLEGCTEMFQSKLKMYIHRGKAHRTPNQSGYSKSKDLSNSPEEQEVIDVPDW